MWPFNRSWPIYLILYEMYLELVRYSSSDTKTLSSANISVTHKDLNGIPNCLFMVACKLYSINITDMFEMWSVFVKCSGSSRLIFFWQSLFYHLLYQLFILIIISKITHTITVFFSSHIGARTPNSCEVSCPLKLY